MYSEVSSSINPQANTRTLKIRSIFGFILSCFFVYFSLNTLTVRVSLFDFVRNFLSCESVTSEHVERTVARRDNGYTTYSPTCKLLTTELIDSVGFGVILFVIDSVMIYLLY